MAKIYPYSLYPEFTETVIGGANGKCQYMNFSNKCDTSLVLEHRKILNKAQLIMAAQRQNPIIDEQPKASLDFYSCKRKPTDVCFLTVFATFFTVLFCSVGYCIYYGDINRIIYGYDNCGTVCGDTPIENPNKTMLKLCYEIREKTGHFGQYHLISQVNSKEYDRICTDSCDRYPTYKRVFNRCLPKNKKTALSISHIKYFFVQVSEDFEYYWKDLGKLCIIALGLSLCTLVLFHYLVGYVVWLVLAGVTCASIGGAIASWILWVNGERNRDLYTEETLWLYLGLAILTTLVAIIVVCIIIFMRKKIQLVIQLFEEAGKAVAAMPGLFFEPILTFLTLSATLVLWVYLCLWISSSGHLTERRPNVFYYHRDGFMKLTGVLNFLGMLWMVQFLIGCQHMVVAGAVSKWYFTRNKSQLSSPIIHSAYNVSRYHLGSIALGSFLITLIHVIRIIVTALRKVLQKERNSVLMMITKACLCCCDCFLKCLEHFVKLITRNAYIITAMYGYSFCKAGRKALNNFLAHPFSLAAINSVGDFVLFLSKVLVVVATVTLGSYQLKEKQEIQHVWVPLVLAGLFSYFISHCFITVYEMTIDTIFICFCEDSNMNDGLSKPYYMSRGLMEYVDNAKTAMKVHDKKKIFENRQLNSEIPSLSKSVERKAKADQI